MGWMRPIAVSLAAALLSCSAADQLANGAAHARHCPGLSETLQIGVITIDPVTGTAAISREGMASYSSFWFDDPRSKTGIDVEVGNSADTRHTTHYPKATQATRESLAKLGIDEPWALVEFESNCGDFVSPSHLFLTGMRRLDGSAEFPLDLTQLVEQLSARNTELLTAHAEAIDASLIEQAKSVFIRGPQAVDPSSITSSTVPLLYWLGDVLLASFQNQREIVEMGSRCGAEGVESCHAMSAQVVAQLLVTFTIDRTGKIVDEQVTPPTVTAASFPAPP